jgi:hypothetical protein
VECSCEHGNERSGSINPSEIFKYLSDMLHLKQDSAAFSYKKLLLWLLSIVRFESLADPENYAGGRVRFW